MKSITDYPNNIKIPVCEVVDYARELMKPEDIDHYGLGKGMDDLYLKVNAQSFWIVQHMETRVLASTFKSNFDGTLWYDLPFLYHE